MVNDIFHDRARYSRMIKYPADDNCVVRRIVMPQAIAGAILAPSHLRPSEQSMKKSRVEIIKYFFQMIGVTLRCADFLTAPQLLNQVCFLRDVLRRGVAAITR